MTHRPVLFSVVSVSRTEKMVVPACYLFRPDACVFRQETLQSAAISATPGWVDTVLHRVGFKAGIKYGLVTWISGRRAFRRKLPLMILLMLQFLFLLLLLFLIR